MRIVINKRYGGFILTKEMMDYIGYVPSSEWDRGYYVSRTDPKLIEYLDKTDESLHGSLKVVDIPDDIDYVIEEYDGKEWVSEKHRTWS